MTEPQRLFLVQARSDYDVFRLLREQPRARVPECHPLHYLQMSTEKLGKAWDWGRGQGSLSHKALVAFLESLESTRSAQRILRYAGKNQAWSSVIRESIPLAT